jgi:hypothetical protein
MQDGTNEGVITVGPRVRDNKTASASTPPSYATWKDPFAAELFELHGIKANVRERPWRSGAPRA